MSSAFRKDQAGSNAGFCRRFRCPCLPPIRFGIYDLEHRLERQAEGARCGRLRVADPDHDHGHPLRERRHNLSSGVLDSLTLIDKVAFVDQVYGVKLADVIELNADSSDTLQQLVDAIVGAD